MVPLYLSLAALSCLSFASAEPLHVPLTRKRAPSTMDDLAASADFTRSKYGLNSVSTPSKRQSSAAVPIINQVYFFSHLL